MNEPQNIHQKRTCRKYTLEEKQKVLSLHKQGKSKPEISFMTGINVSTIYNWTERKPKKKDLRSSTKKPAKFSDEQQNSFSQNLGFKELTVVSCESSHSEPSPPDGWVQIFSPEGFKMFVPPSELQIFSLFFQGGISC